MKVNKTFDLLVIPGGGHGMGGVSGTRKLYDFFAYHLLGINPPDLNTIKNVRKEKLNHEKGTAEGRLFKLGDTHPHKLESIKNLIDLYEARNKQEKANGRRTKLA